MNREQLATRVHAIISDYLLARRKSEAEITDATRFVCDLKLDSLDRVDVTMQAEDEFDLELDDAAVTEMVTVGDLVDHLAVCLAVAA